jgi:hypothetical protein
MVDSAASVSDKICAAFAATPYPGDENIAVDQTGHDPECNEIATAFAGKRWTQITPEILREFSQSLPLLTSPAFRYFLPAYMIGTIDPQVDLSGARDFVVFNLTPPGARTGWQADLFRARAELFTTEERDAIRSFLELMEQQKRAEWESEGRHAPLKELQQAIRFWKSPG